MCADGLSCLLAEQENLQSQEPQMQPPDSPHGEVALLTDKHLAPCPLGQVMSISVDLPHILARVCAPGLPLPFSVRTGKRSSVFSTTACIF